MVDTIDLNVVRPYWLRKKREWIRKGAPAAVAPAGLFPMLSGQRHFTPIFERIWNVGILKEPKEGIHQVPEGWLFPQIVKELDLVGFARETLNHWRKTAVQLFPALKTVLE